MSHKGMEKLLRKILVFILCGSITLGSSGMTVLAQGLSDENDVAETDETSALEEDTVDLEESMEEITTSEESSVAVTEDEAEAESEGERKEEPEDETQEVFTDPEEPEINREVSGDYEYENISGSKIKITKYSGKDKKLTIPKELDGYTVTVIGKSVFKDNTTLTSVTFPDTIEEIGNEAFSGCTGIKEIVLPDSVVAIWYKAFNGCTSLEKFDMGKNVEEIGEYAFGGCSKLSDLTLSEALTTIWSDAFRNCSSLTEITIPKSLTTAKLNGSYGYYGIFSGCTKLTKVTFEDGLKTVPNNLFYSCPGLEEVVLPDSVEAIGTNAFFECTALEKVDMGKNVEWIGQKAFGGCSKLSDLTFSNALEKIYSDAFQNCSSLTEVTIPKSLTTAELYNSYGYNGIFSGCTKLAKVTFEDGIKTVPAYLFYNCPGIEEVILPDSAESIGYEAFYNCTSLKKVDMGKSVEWIGQKAFGGCSRLSDLTFSSALDKIYSDAFQNCSSLTEVTIPKSLTTAELYNSYGYNGIFSGCTKLVKATFEDGIKTVPSNLFYGCPGLDNVVLPDSVETIGKNAFNGCTGIKKVVLPDSVKTIGDQAFYGCTSLEKADTGKGVEKIGQKAFGGCSKLSELTFSGVLTTILSDAFQNCTSLTEVTIPKSLTTAELYNSYGYNGIFSGCTKLAKVTFEDGIKAVPAYLFYNCPGIEEAVLPDSVESIGYEAFYGCTSLEKVDMGKNVEWIGQKAFCGCSRLSDLTFSSSLQKIYSDAFQNCTSLTEVTIPKSLTTAELYNSYGYNGIFSGCKKLTTAIFEDGMEVVPSYLFYGCSGLEHVVLPKSITTIKSNAFKECSNLKEIKLYENVSKIESNAFSNTDKMIVYGIKGTYAETWANEVGAEFKEMILAATISLNEESVELKKKETVTLTATVTPQDQTEDIIWLSSDRNVAAVKNGVVTAVGVGEAVITAKVGDKSAACTITVLKVPVTELILDQESVKLNKGENISLIAKAAPEDHTETIVWTSSDEEVATVKNGVVTAVGAGEAVITVKAGEMSATCKVSVLAPATAIALDKESAELKKGESVTLTAKVTPKDCTDEITWTSSDEKIATVEDGVVTAVGAGEAVITVTAGKVSATCKINILAPATAISLNKESLELKKRRTEKLIATVTPEDCTDEIIWTSSDEKIATVKDGIVTAVEEGEAVITVKAGKVSATCKVTVQPVSNEMDAELVNGYIYTFTGTAIKPAISVRNDGTILREGVDYTVKYSNNVKAADKSADKAPTITVKGKGNYTGSVSVKFTILQKSLEGKDDPESANATQAVKYPSEINVLNKTKAAPVLIYGKLKLGKKDYFLSTRSDAEVAPDKITEDTELYAIGKGNYSGVVKIKVNRVMNKTDLVKLAVNQSKDFKPEYTGSEVKPVIGTDVKVTAKGSEEPLKEGTDFIIAYSADTINAGKVDYKVIGLGKYSGMVSKSYTIAPIKATADQMTMTFKEDKPYTYKLGGTTVEDLTVKYTKMDKALEAGKDYKISYSANKKVGSAAKVTVSFLGNYKGSKAVSRTFQIVQANLDEIGTAKVVAADKIYNKAGVYASAPVVEIDGTVLKSSDYTLRYEYKADGEWKLMDKQNKLDLESLKVDSVSARVVVVGKGNFTTDEKHALIGVYTIRKLKEGEYDLSKAKVTFYDEKHKKNVTMYTGGEAIPYEVEVTCAVNGKTVPLKEGVDFTITYAGNVNKGKATAVLTGTGVKGTDGCIFVGSKTAKYSVGTKSLTDFLIFKTARAIFGGN